MAKLGDEDALARAENPVGRDFSEALARGLRVIGAFSADARAMTLSDVARVVDMPRATVRRALLTLVHLGYVEEDGRLFRLTPRILGLASAYLGSSTATSILQPACEQLSAYHGETFSVAILDGTDAVMIAYARPRSMYAESVGIGLRIPAYCSAIGRVLLAGLPEERLDAFFAAITPEAITPKTITDPVILRKLLHQVDDEGFALAEQEAELGFRSLAVPVRRRTGEVQFALNVGMSVHRAPFDTMQSRFVPLLRDAAERLQEQLL